MHDIDEQSTNLSTEKPKTKTKKPFKLPEYKTYEGPRGNPADWQAAFESRMGVDKAKEILRDGSPRSILGVALNCKDWNLIKSAYRDLVKKYHPDMGIERDGARFIKVQAAYEILADELKQ